MPPIGNGLAGGSAFFFAVQPDQRARAAIVQAGERFRELLRLPKSPVETDRLHLMLSPPGRPQKLWQSLESTLMAAASDVRAPCFELALDSVMRLSARDGQHPLVLCTDDVSSASALKLRKAIAEAQQRAGLIVPAVSLYLPHVVLLHGRSIDAIHQSIPPIRWTVREFVLMRCFFGQSRYEVVRRWALDAPC
ncbi:MAG: 2'-5' RNA ligase [Rhodanobacter sp.]|nr:MAG: 2'-5' RNA ligase [Rhodanobacter sp.]